MSDATKWYVKIDLSIGSMYVQPLDDLQVLIDEIKGAVDCDNFDSIWTVSLVEMSEAEYAELPEFLGH
jgi:hypothetical protein